MAYFSLKDCNNILVTLIHVLDLRDFDSLDIFEIVSENELTMKFEHFKLALRGLTINAKNKKAVRRVLVEKESRKDVIESMEIDNSQLGKQINRVLKNLKVQLEKHNLELSEWVVDKEMKPILEILQAKSIQLLDVTDKLEKAQTPKRKKRLSDKK